MKTFKDVGKEHEELLRLTEPLMNYLKQEYHPHARIIVDCNSAEVVEGVLCVVEKCDKE